MLVGGRNFLEFDEFSLVKFEFLNKNVMTMWKFKSSANASATWEKST